MIPYHGTDFNGADQPIFSVQGRHVMVSYARAAQLPEVAELSQSFALDNGAFTTWKQGETYDMRGYFEWVDKWQRHPGFDWYLIPDAIGGDEHDNARMRAEWFNMVGGWTFQGGVPVWHLHEPIKVLEGFANSWRRVAIGSSGQYATIGTPAWWSRMAEAMAAVCDDEGRPRSKLHGLRMLDPTLYSQFPFASADSTNASRNISLDDRWKGPYAPASRRMRALLLMERIESHAAASRWTGQDIGIQANLDLIG